VKLADHSNPRTAGYDNAGNLTDLPTTDGSPNHEFVPDYRNRLIEVKNQSQRSSAK